MTRPDCADVAAALLAPPDGGFRLADADPGARPFFADKSDAAASLKDDAKAIDRLQNALYAEREQALLVVLQGIDTAGKGGVIRTVFNDTGPRGVRVAPFGKPTDLELAHDYLWRVHQVVPPKGFIGVFDRSHYEDVLVVKVRNLAPADAVERRYDQINAFERHLSENGVTVLKFFLHISRDEQAKRLRARLENPDKHWKFNPGDIEERKLWDAYMEAYETALQRCSTPWAPWRVTPSDSKTRRNALIARVVRGTLENMSPRYPSPGWSPDDYVID